MTPGFENEGPHHHILLILRVSSPRWDLPYAQAFSHRPSVLTPSNSQFGHTTVAYSFPHQVLLPNPKHTF